MMISRMTGTKTRSKPLVVMLSRENTALLGLYAIALAQNGLHQISQPISESLCLSVFMQVRTVSSETSLSSGHTLSKRALDE